MFVGVYSTMVCIKECGMGFCAADACGVKHIQYRNGQIHILTTRDGNNKLCPLAWSISNQESGTSYTYFARNCSEFGLGDYLNQPHHVIFSDRDKGVPALHAEFEVCYSARCFRHIIANARRWVNQQKSGEKFTDEQAWTLQRAKTYEQFQLRLNVLAQDSPLAAIYFNTKVHHPDAYQYAFYDADVATHGHATSNAVEILNGAFVEARHHLPYWFNDKILIWMGDKHSEREKTMKAEISQQRLLTPYVRKL